MANVNIIKEPINYQVTDPSYNYSGLYPYTDKSKLDGLPSTSNILQKSSITGLVKNDGTIDPNTYLADVHFDQTVTLSTSASTTATFTNTAILSTSLIDVAVSEWGLVPEDVTVSAGVCTVTLPKVSSAHSVTVRIYVR